MATAVRVIDLLAVEMPKFVSFPAGKEGKSVNG